MKRVAVIVPFAVGEADLARRRAQTTEVRLSADIEYQFLPVQALRAFRATTTGCYSMWQYSKLELEPGRVGVTRWLSTRLVTQASTPFDRSSMSPWSARVELQCCSL